MIKKPRGTVSAQGNGEEYECTSFDSYISAIQKIVHALGSMTKKNIQSFFPEQYNEVMDMLKRAYMQDENNSLLLLARSKQTLYTLTSQVEQDIQAYMQEKNKDFNLRAIRVNATMSNSEPKF